MAPEPDIVLILSLLPLPLLLQRGTLPLLDAPSFQKKLKRQAAIISKRVHLPSAPDCPLYRRSAMSSPGEWYQALPPVTKVWLTTAVLSGVGAKLKLISPGLLHFAPALVFSKKLQVRLARDEPR